jgi:hypothetical protein
MPTCPNCRVELAADASACPLCGTPVGASAAEPSQQSFLDPSGDERLSEAERRTIAWELLSVSAGIGALVVSAVNLLVDRTLSWALYPIASLGLAWILISAPLMLRKRPLAAACIVAVALPAYLVGLDLIDGGLTWAPRLAVPIALMVEASAAAATLASLKTKRKGPNVLAYCLLAVSASCAGVDAAVGFHGYGRIAFGWSAIVASALVPVAAFLLYLHHRVTKKANLRKLFRL